MPALRQPVGRDVSPTSPLINERALFLPGQLHTIQLPVSPVSCHPESSILRPFGERCRDFDTVTLGHKDAGSDASLRETYQFDSQFDKLRKKEKHWIKRKGKLCV